MNSNDNTKRESSWKKFGSLFFCAASICGLVLFVVSHATRADILMLPTAFPVAVWLLVGLVCSVLIDGWKKTRIFLLVVTWLCMAFLMGDYPINMFKGYFDDLRAFKHEKTIRVVSINCASSTSAVRECIPHEPHVIMIQESVGRNALNKIAEELDGFEALWSADASLLVKGAVESFEVPADIRGEYVFCKVKLSCGAELFVCNLRLVPNSLRFDVWNPSAWTEFQQNRQKRYKQLRRVCELIQVHDNTPLILGGDFNAPAGDAIFELLKPTLRDSYAEGGKGWGKTIINEYPAHRIDQIWISDRLRSASVRAIKTENSDHRMVVADLIYEH